MRTTAPPLDAAAPDFVPVAKTHLVRGHVLPAREKSNAVTFFNNGFRPAMVNAGVTTATAHSIVCNGFATFDADEVVGVGRGEVVNALPLVGAKAVTMNYNAAIKPILVRASELHANGVAYSQQALQNEVVHASRTLDAGAVSKLTRVVKTWAGGQSTFDSEGGVVPFLLTDGQHRVLASRYAWYRRWSARALSTAFFGVKTADLLRALRERSKELRSSSTRVTAPTTHYLAEQLERLAHAIVPHAPPRGHVTQVRIPVEAGEVI